MIRICGGREDDMKLGDNRSYKKVLYNNSSVTSGCNGSYSLTQVPWLYLKRRSTHGPTPGGQRR
jgi:hypothetical protein